MIKDINNGQFEYEFSESTGLTKMPVPEKCEIAVFLVQNGHFDAQIAVTLNNDNFDFK